MTENPEIHPIPSTPAAHQPIAIDNRCLAVSCSGAVLAPTRFCDGCFADAAKDLARRIEAELIACGFAAGSYKLRDALAIEAQLRRLEWYVDASPILGELRVTEANYLRDLTEAACVLVSRGGVAALASLPGTRRLEQPAAARCDFKALRQFEETEPNARAMPLPLMQQQIRYNAYCAAVLLTMLAALLVLR